MEGLCAAASGTCNTNACWASPGSSQHRGKVVLAGVQITRLKQHVAGLSALKRKAAAKLILQRVSEAYGEMMLTEGLFQADAHPGCARFTRCLVSSSLHAQRRLTALSALQEHSRHARSALNPRMNPFEVGL